MEFFFYSVLLDLFLPSFFYSNIFLRENFSFLHTFFLSIKIFFHKSNKLQSTKINPVIWFLIFYQILFNFKRNNDEDEDDTENDDQDDGPTCFFGMFFFFFFASLLFLFCVKFLFPFFLFPTTRTLALSILFLKDDYDDEDIFFFQRETITMYTFARTHTKFKWIKKSLID